MILKRETYETEKVLWYTEKHDFYMRCLQLVVFLPLIANLNRFEKFILSIFKPILEHNELT